MKMVRAYDLDMLNKTSALVVLEVSLVPFFTEISWGIDKNASTQRIRFH